jgi:hypothetical protein
MNPVHYKKVSKARAQKQNKINKKPLDKHHSMVYNKDNKRGKEVISNEDLVRYGWYDC